MKKKTIFIIGLIIIILTARYLLASKDIKDFPALAEADDLTPEDYLEDFNYAFSVL